MKMSDEFDALINQNKNRDTEVVGQVLDETERHKQEIRAVIDGLRKYTQKGYPFTKEDREIVNSALYKYIGSTHEYDQNAPTYYHIINRSVNPKKIKIGGARHHLTADDLEKIEVLKNEKQLFFELLDMVKKASHERISYESRKETQRNWIIALAVIGALGFLISRCFAG
jgi:hypothetical protein